MEAEAPAKEWRCFFCDEVFTTRQDAADHFAEDQLFPESPGCITKMKETEKAIVEDRRLWRNRALVAEIKLEESEGWMNVLEFDLGRILRKPRLQSADVGQLKGYLETVEGRLFAAEARLKAIRQWNEDVGKGYLSSDLRLGLEDLLEYRTDVPDLSKEEKERLLS